MIQSLLATAVSEDCATLEKGEPAHVRLRPEYRLRKTTQLAERFAHLPLNSKTEPGMVFLSVLACAVALSILAILYSGLAATNSAGAVYETIMLGLTFGVMASGVAVIFLRCLRLLTSLNSDVHVDSDGIQSPRDFDGLLPWNQISNVRVNCKGRRTFTVDLQIRIGGPTPKRVMQALLFGELRPDRVVLHLTYNSQSRLAGEVIGEAARLLGRSAVRYPGA